MLILAKPFMRFMAALSEWHTQRSLWEAEAQDRREGALTGLRARGEPLSPQQGEEVLGST